MKEQIYIYYNTDKFKGSEKEINKIINGYVKKNNFKIKRKFIDNNNTNEKGLIDLMNYTSIEKDIKKVVILSRSNISNDNIFVMWIEKELLKNDTIIKYIRPQYLKNNELEILRERIIGAFARYEKEKLPNRLAAHREYKIFETGIKASGNCPIGYRYSGKNSREKKVVVVKEEAKLVKEIYQLYLKYKSLGKLKKHLDKKGFLTRRKKEFSRQALYNILTNKFYIGVLSYNQYKYVSVGDTRNKKPILIEERRIDGKHEKIISKELFNKVNKILEKNNKHKNDYKYK